MKAIKLLTSIIILFFLSLFFSDAQDILYPPTNFNAEIVKTNSGQAVKLTWERNDEGVTPDVYNIYMVFGDTEKLNMIGQVHYQDNIDTYKYYFHNIHSGTYSFFAKSAKFDSNRKMIESEKSDVVTLNIEEQPYIKFLSKPITVAKIGEKYIYEIKATSNIKCKIGFELIDHPDAMSIKGNVISWKPQKEGEYRVSVKAFFPECETEVHSVQSFVIRVGQGHTDKPFLKLILEPVVKVDANRPFQYRIRYESNIDCPVNFKFASEVPDGMQLVQGMIIWNQPQAGEYKIVIKAVLDCNFDVSDTKGFELIVGDGGDPHHFCANIIGNINFDDDNPVPDGIVQAWKLDRNDFENKRMFMGQIQKGEFSINLPEGNYALNIIGKTFIPEWFEDAEFITDAKRIEIACDDEITINAKVEALPQPKLYNVSGRVYDAETNKPLPAMVEFIPVHKAFGDLKPNENQYQFATKTDKDGNYSIQLPDNFTYIAHAISAMNSKQYQNNFYDNVTNPTEADLINLTSDLRDINFAMKLVPQALGGFSGTVKNGEGNPLFAKVIAILISSQDSHYNHKFSQTVETDREGVYHFNHLPSGKYVVMSIPEDKHYIPGYYKMNDFAVLKWKEATIIEVGDMMIDIMYDIKHKQRGEGGVAQIGGFIFANGGNIIKDNHSQAGVPVAGAFVYIIDKDGIISDFTFSDSKGMFNLPEVNQGNLMLIADKVGFESFEIPVETNYNEKANVELNVQLQEAITDIQDFNNSDNLLIYPIPSSNQTIVEFNSNGINTRIDILNVQGVLVKSMSMKTIQGINKIQIDLKDLSDGYYFIKISDGRTIKTSPLIILR